MRVRWLWQLATVGFVSGLLVGGLQPVGVTQPANPESETTPQRTVGQYIEEGDRAYTEANFKEAVKAYSQAIELFPQGDYAFYNRGNAYRQLKEYEAAVADYSQALKLNPQNRFAYRYRGIAYHELDKPELAIADYNKMIEMNEKDPKPYSDRAESYLALDKKSEAIADLVKAEALYREQDETGQAELIKSRIRALR